ncbi:phage/plasmid replication protein, II/X family, partial [Xanthomonas maliensis]|uniref:phage/plasmid replication protein, II/X family n=1 Tax=Xanthomonas maliensis TaxID=1321368 RepID=UPI001265366D
AHPARIDAGKELSVGASGDVGWMSSKRQTVTGSFSSGLTVRTVQRSVDPCTHLEISGNPVKFFQGHNLWGADDVPGLVMATMEHLVGVLSLAPTDLDRLAWSVGDVQITRVDVTQSFHLQSRGEVLAWLRAAEQTAHLSHRGRGQLVKGSTLYFGQHSRRWSLKLYSKGQEIHARGHGQDAILNLPHAVAWADRTLRAELTIRSMELKRMALDQVAAWKDVDGVPFDASVLLRDRLGSMTMTTARTLPEDVIASLTTGQHNAYLAWAAGNDLRETMSRPSFYRLRSKLLPHGVDIATLMPKEVSNVVPLYRVLEAVPVSVPDWAVGTPLYFEPRRVA